MRKTDRVTKTATATTTTTTYYDKSNQNRKQQQHGERFFTFYVFIPLVDVTHTLKRISKRATIRELKELIEISCGIPTTLQRLYFLDRSDLEDNRTLTSLDIVNKATFILDIWTKWEKIISCVYKNDFEGLLTYALCQDTRFVVPPVASREKRGEVALFSAVKLGNVDLTKNLIQNGVNVKARSELGFTVLHVAVANGKYQCIDVLLENGAENDTKTNRFGQMALSLSKQNGYLDSDRHLCRFEWQLRSKTASSKPSRQVPLLPHQQFDSKTPTWFNGEYSTKFVCNTLPLLEFSGTRINAPKIVPVKPLYTEDEDYFDTVDNGAERLRSYITRDTWLRRKQEEQVLLRQKHEQLAAIRLLEKEREELEKKRVLAQRKRENEKRTMAMKDSASDKYRKKQNMYDDYTYVPGYGKTVLQQYMNDLMIS